MRNMTVALSAFVIVTGCALAAQQHDAQKAGAGTASAQAKPPIDSSTVLSDARAPRKMTRKAHNKTKNSDSV